MQTPISTPAVFLKLSKHLDKVIQVLFRKKDNTAIFFIKTKEKKSFLIEIAYSFDRDDRLQFSSFEELIGVLNFLKEVFNNHFFEIKTNQKNFQNFISTKHPNFGHFKDKNLLSPIY